MCGFHIQLIVWYYLVVFAVDAGVCISVTVVSKVGCRCDMLTRVTQGALLS